VTTRLPALRASLALLLLGGLANRPVGAQAGSPTDRLDAAVAAAEASLKRGDLAGAEGRYGAVLLEGWLLRGWLEAAEGRLETAREAFERAATDGADERRAVEARAFVALQTGRTDAAIEDLSRLAEKEPRDAALRRLLAQAHLASGHPERAVSELEAARAAVPGDLELAFALATAYLAEKRVEEAERIFAEIRKARPIPQTRVLIGRAYRDASQFDRARAEFQAALAQDPRVRRAHYYLGMTLLINEGVPRADDAIAEFRKELAVSPDDPTTHLFLGAALVLAGRPEEALPSLERATRAPGAPARAFFFLGRCLLALGRPAEAAEAERRALERAKGSPEASLVQGIHYQLGLALRKAGDAEGAAVHLAEAQRLSALAAERSPGEFGGPPADGPVSEDPRPAIDPSLVPSPVADLPPDQRAKTLGRVTEALTRAYVNLGVIETQGRRFDRAAQRFEAAAGLDPDFPQVQYFLGVALYNAGQYERAAESLERARATRSDDADLRRMLAMAWFNTGDYAKAVPLLRDDPQREANPSLQLTYGVALVRSGDLETAARLDPQNAEIHSLLAEAYRALGRMEEAQQQVEIVHRLNESRRPGPP
jgi:tetratricopeptide (TPR) repeat protein